MELENIIKLLEILPDAAGLNDWENWDDSDEVTQWRLDSIIALGRAVDILKRSEVVGTLNIDGVNYEITK